MQLSKLLLITVLTLICVVFSISQAVSKEKIFNTGTGGFMFVYPGNWIDITPQATDSNPQGPGIIAAVKAPIFVIGGEL